MNYTNFHMTVLYLYQAGTDFYIDLHVLYVQYY